MIVFYLAEDRETGKIIDGGFLSYPSYVRVATKAARNEFAETGARDFCAGWNFKLLDVDGPHSETLWRFGFRKPKWRDRRPLGIAKEKWGERLKSTDELAAYKAGLESSNKSA